MEIPEQLRYTKDHEWVRADGNTATVGITEYAVEELGDVVYVELPDTGTEVEKGEVFGTIESVKAVAELFAPVSGDVDAANEALDETPEMVNDDPYDASWMVKITMSNVAELDDLLSAEQYQAYLEEIA